MEAVDTLLAPEDTVVEVVVVVGIIISRTVEATTSLLLVLVVIKVLEVAAAGRVVRATLASEGLTIVTGVEAGSVPGVEEGVAIFRSLSVLRSSC